MIAAELRRRIPGTFAAAAVAAGLVLAASTSPSFQVASEHLDEDSDLEQDEDLTDDEESGEDGEDLTQGEGVDEEGESEDPDGEETEGDEEQITAFIEQAEDDGERSDTAKRVHAALSGSSELGPGDEGFGQAVSERARTMHLGSVVSEAARGNSGGNDLEAQGETDEESEQRSNRGRGNAFGRNR